MPKGKCLIYKRATLYDKSTGEARIVDYSNGTRAFDCKVLDMGGPEKMFIWNVGDTQIPIPLNVNRNDVPSIIQTGRIDYNDAQHIEWEYIFGRFHSYSEYFSKHFVFGLLALVLSVYLFRKKS